MHAFLVYGCYAASSASADFFQTSGLYNKNIHLIKKGQPGKHSHQRTSHIGSAAPDDEDEIVRQRGPLSFKTCHHSCHKWAPRKGCHLFESQCTKEARACVSVWSKHKEGGRWVTRCSLCGGRSWNTANYILIKNLCPCCLPTEDACVLMLNWMCASIQTGARCSVLVDVEALSQFSRWIRPLVSESLPALKVALTEHIPCWNYTVNEQSRFITAVQNQNKQLWHDCKKDDRELHNNLYTYLF